VGQTTETDVVLYIRHMLEGKATVAAGNTIQVALAALKNHFKYDPSKLELLSGPMVAEALKVGKRDGKQVVKKKPLTVVMLHAMYQWYVSASARTGASGWTDSRDLCMMILMMAAFLRESELIQLVPADIQIKTITPAAANGQEEERVILEVYVRKAKNDQAGQGHLIRIAEAKGSPICPVFWVNAAEAEAEERRKLSLLSHVRRHLPPSQHSLLHPTEMGGSHQQYEQQRLWRPHAVRLPLVPHRGGDRRSCLGSRHDPREAARQLEIRRRIRLHPAHARAAAQRHAVHSVRKSD